MTTYAYACECPSSSCNERVHISRRLYAELSPLGVILGPIVAGLFVTSWAIFGAAYRDVLGDQEQE